MRILSVTTQRNEGAFLLEWLAWHQLIGVTDFIVFSNDCTDGSDLLLDALARQGVLTHRRNIPPADQSLQWNALHEAWRDPLRKSTDWMLISDLDEFPMIHAGAHGLADLIAALPDETDAIALSWRLFGAASLDGYRDEPVTQRFLRSAPEGLFLPFGASFFKSLFRPGAFGGPGVHRPRHKRSGAPRWCDGSGRALPDPYAQNDKRLSLAGLRDYQSLAEMHHYSLRSAQSFIVKSERGLPNRHGKQIDLGYWLERNFNTVTNRAALALAQPLADAIAALKSLPDVGALHQQAVTWHSSRFEQLIRTPAGYELYCRILLAADSAVLPAAQSRALLHRFSQLE